MNQKRKILIVVAVLLCYGGLAQAVPITIQISGTITSTSGNGLPSTIHEGVIFTGVYTYDSLTSDLYPSSQRGEYQINDMSIVISGYEFKVAPKLVIMDDDPVNGVKDYYIVYTGKDFTVPSAGLTIDYIRWALWDSSHTAFSSDALPITAPVLTKWDHNVLDIYGFDSLGYGLSIQGTITHATPEPLTGVLLTMGVFFLRRKR
ncbi:MAG: hypothetical protein WC770_07600 [Phycisphaerae bacterium]|jgi:hypothetical protein